MFYGQLKIGCRTRGVQRKRNKDALKSTQKSCSTPLNTWETTATNRPLWCHTSGTGLQDFEQKQLQIIKDRRTHRKNGQPPQGPATNYDCAICGRQQRTQPKNGQPPQGPATIYNCTLCGHQQRTQGQIGQTPQGPATTYDCTICGHQQRTQRKYGQPPQGPATTYDCTICGCQCASPIG